MYYQPVEHDFRLFYEADDTDTNYLYDDAYIGADIQILIYDKETGEVIDHQYFTSKGGKYAR